MTGTEKWTMAGAVERLDRAQVAAHMARSIKDYDHDHTCRGCGRPVRITVQHPVSVTVVLQHWHDRLGGRCKECLKKDGKAVAE